MEQYSGFSNIYDEAMDNIPYEKWSEDITELLKQQGIESGVICELGCGTGTMTELLAKKGYQMIGVDMSADMLQQAMEKKLASGADIQYVMQDMRELTLHHPVDAMISVCDSMNYITEDEDLKQVFARAREFLNPSGIFLFDMKTEYCYEMIIGDHVMVEHTEDTSCIWENTYYKEEKINEYALTIFEREPGTELFRRYEEVHEQRAYEIQEVENALREAGFSLLYIYGGQIGKELTEDCERIYFVAHIEQQKNGGKK